ncbi:MAG: glycerol-3-phosphate dehydrogenase/oxidase [Vicinamibacterales bacterium]
MQRDLGRLAGDPFDVVVIGAGIYGALAAWDAAARGLHVALIDRGDFGSGTSFNSLKTLHGGLRSLQSLSLRQMRLFIRERRALARMAPHLVQPLPFCVPTSGWATRSPAALRVALALTDLVGLDRNDGVDEALCLPGGRTVSRDECLRLNPLIAADGVRGGAVWADYQMRQAERVTLAAVRSAAAAGAAAANYVEAVALARTGGTIAAVTVEDRLGGQRFDLRTRAVLNAAGPWAGAVLGRLAASPTPIPATRLSRAMNLVVDRVTTTHACGGVVDGRFLFVVPWRDVSILGTSHDVHDGDADAPHGTRPHVEALLADAARAFPRAGVTADRVRLVHRGLLPMVSGSAAGVALLRESQVVDHGPAGCPGLFSIFSVRYTTARHTAVEAVNAVAAHLGRGGDAGLTAASRVAGAAFASLQTLYDDAEAAQSAGLDAPTRRRLAATYGSEWPLVAALATDQPALAQPLSAACGVTGAEVLYAVRHEAAVTLGDVMLRRTEAGTAGRPDAAATAAAATIMADAFGWHDARVRAERDALEAVYPPR